MIVATPILYKEIKVGDLIAIHYDNTHEGRNDRVGFIEEVDDRSILMDDLSLRRINDEDIHIRRFNRIFVSSVVKIEFLNAEEIEVRRVSNLGFFARLREKFRKR